MTVPPRGARLRRGGRRPGWLLLTVLLVLAILASSALVFTDRVELLKLAVILALWAAVVAAFVSVIYRRQSDLDQAKARDLKLVYDLQLDREISARREYELTVETELRRELASELRAQANDEVVALRAELAALRTNLEILFDADLSSRPAIETDMPNVRAAGRVTASRVDTPAVEASDARTEESPIIDVHAVPHPPENEWADSMAGGAHRLSSQPLSATVPPGRRRKPEEPEQPGPDQPQPPMSPPAPPQPPSEMPRRPMPELRQPEPASAWAPPPPPMMPPMTPPPIADVAAAAPQAQPSPGEWRPAPAEGQWIPAGAPGSNWVRSEPDNAGPVTEYIGRRRAPDQAEPPASPPTPAGPDQSAQPTPAMATAHPGRHSVPAEPAGPADGVDAQPEPVLAAESSTPPPANVSRRHRRHAGSEPDSAGGHHEDGQSAAELLARFQTTPTEGGRRRRREE